MWPSLRHSCRSELTRQGISHVKLKVILHQFWVKNIFHRKLNLEYGGTFTKLFMHVSSRKMFPTTRNLQIQVHVYRPRHYCGDWLTFGCFVPMVTDHNLVKKSFGPMIADHDLVKKSFGPMIADHDLVKKRSNHGCWGKHVHIPDNDYWGIRMFPVVWTNFFVAIILMWYTRNIYIYYFINWTWAIISPKEFKSCVTCILFALLYWNTELSAVKYFAICS